jgi:O-antigen ligase
MSEDANIHGRRKILDLARISFLCLVFSLGFDQLSFEVFGYPVVFTDIVFLIAATAWLVSAIADRKLPVWHGAFWLLFLYLLALTMSAAISVDRAVSIRQLPAEIYLVALAVMGASLVSSDVWLKRSIIAWLWGTAFACAVGLLTVLIFYAAPESSFLEYTTYHYGAVPVGNYPRVTATFVSASMFCNYLNVGLVLTLLASKAHAISVRLAVILLAAIGVCSLFTFSIGLGGVVLAAGVWSWLRSDDRKPLFKITVWTGCAVALAFLVVSFFALQPYPESGRFGTLPLLDIPLIPSSRVLVWSEAAHTFIRDPWFGRGLGMPVTNVVFTNTDGSLSLLTDAHNTFLSVAAQSGLAALAALLLIVFAVMRSWKRAIGADRLVPTALGLAFLCSFIYQGLTGSFEEARHLWVLIGLYFAAEKIDRDQNS